MLKQTIDKTDCAMLNLLQEDGQASNLKITHTFILSKTPCCVNLNLLVAVGGYIQAYQANLDRRRLGFGILAFVEINFPSHTEEALVNFEQAVQEIPEVVSCLIFLESRTICFRLCRKNWSLMKIFPFYHILGFNFITYKQEKQ